MKLQIRPGKYVLAVSGGVDSVVLLDLLSRQEGIELVVAHFDHGIRPDSSEDRLLVETLSQKYGLEFEFGEGKLGSKASEAESRQARYEYLQQIRKKHDATAIITAHHKDDAVETLAFNVLRGTKRKGMSSLQSTDGIIRPLLKYKKSELADYAKHHNLNWREDSTNSDEKYTRNWIRRKLLPKLNSRQKRELTDVYTEAASINLIVDDAVQEQLDRMESGQGISRKKFSALPYSVACEVMAAWLRQHSVKDFDRKLIDKLVVSCKTLPPGKKISLGRHGFLYITADSLQLI